MFTRHRPVGAAAARVSSSASIPFRGDQNTAAGFAHPSIRMARYPLSKRFGQKFNFFTARVKIAFKPVRR